MENPTVFFFFQFSSIIYTKFVALYFGVDKSTIIWYFIVNEATHTLFLKNFKKSVDKGNIMWYDVVKRKGGVNLKQIFEVPICFDSNDYRYINAFLFQEGRKFYVKFKRGSKDIMRRAFPTEYTLHFKFNNIVYDTYIEFDKIR